MSAMLIRNLSEDVRTRLREMAQARGMSLEALARDLLNKAAHDSRPCGIDFDRIAEEHAQLGIGDGPDWTEALDDPALSRRLLGFEE